MVKKIKLPQDQQKMLEKIGKIHIVGPCTLPQNSIGEIMKIARQVRIKRSQA